MSVENRPERLRVPTLTEVLNVPELSLDAQVDPESIRPVVADETSAPPEPIATPMEAVEPVPVIRAESPAPVVAVDPALPHWAEATVPLPSLAQAMPLQDQAPVAIPPPAQPVIDQEQVVARVVADLQRRADQMLEYRLREALGPLLERATAQLVADARTELAATLRDIVARAVSQELARLRRHG